MNKLDTFACDQIGVDVVNTWPPVPVLGPGTISFYAAEAKRQRAQAITAAFKHMFIEPAPDDLLSGVNESSLIGSPKSVGRDKLRNAQF
jgi:hypothetical protein